MRAFRPARYREQLAIRLRGKREAIARGCTCAYDANAFRSPDDDCPLHGWRQDPRFAQRLEREKTNARLAK